MNTTKERDRKFLERAIELSKLGMQSGNGGPFGCIVVQGDEIVGEGNNMVTSSNDPTAHAEVVAIRNACEKLGTYQLTDCEIYTSCEPCPMCLGAIYWARPKKIYFALDQKDAQDAGFDDSFIYEEIPLAIKERKIPMIPFGRNEAIVAFEEWIDKLDKTAY